VVLAKVGRYALGLAGRELGARVSCPTEDLTQWAQMVEACLRWALRPGPVENQLEQLRRYHGPKLIRAYSQHVEGLVLGTGFSLGIKRYLF
jgi:hypothetical protein